MTSRERVLAATMHRQPDRVPIDVTDQLVASGMRQRLFDRVGTDDFRQVLEYLNVDLWWVGIRDGWRLPYVGPELDASPNHSRLQEVGYYVETVLQDTWGDLPLCDVSSVHEVAQYGWPDAGWWDYGALPDLCAAGGDRAIMLAPNSWGPTFYVISRLCGMDKTLTMMYDAPAVLDALVAHVTDFYLEVCRRSCEVAASQADIYYHGDDVASQRNLIFSVEMWRRYFKEPLRRRFELVHRYGLKNSFHSCGAVRALIPDLIEIGMDILTPVQTRAAGMDAVSLKHEFGRDLTFYGGLDIQQVLPFGTSQEVREEVRRLIAAACRPRDKGLIATLYEGGCRIGELLPLQIKRVQPRPHGIQLTIKGTMKGERRLLLIASAAYL